MESIEISPLPQILGKLPHYVKGNPANDYFMKLGFIPHMEINREKQLEIIAEGVKRLRTNRHALEKKAGVPVGTIKDLKRGKRAMVSDRWQKIQNALSEPAKIKSILPEAEIAIFDALKIILALIIKNGGFDGREVKDKFTQLFDAYPEEQKISRQIIHLLRDTAIDAALALNSRNSDRI